MTRIIEQIRADLKAAADEKTQASSRRFFKEEIRLYGVKTARVTKISKTHFAQVQDLSKDDIFALCEELLESGYLEEAGIAANWSYRINDRYEPGDFAVFEREHQAEVFEYVQRNKAVMPRTSLRYAIEKMPQEMRKKAMDS